MATLARFLNLLLLSTSWMVVRGKLEAPPSCSPPSIGTSYTVPYSSLNICVNPFKKIIIEKSAIWYLLGENEQVETPLPDVLPLGGALGAQVPPPGMLSDIFCYLLWDVFLDALASLKPVLFTE